MMVIQALKEYNCQTRLLHQAKLYIIIDGEIKSLCDKQKLKECMTTRTALQKILKGILHSEKEDKHMRKNKSH
jgi:hypothetical protein